MEDWKQRTRLLLGDEGVLKLEKSRVFILGTGGVGGFAAEFLARAGVGTLILADSDTVSITNRNRQIQALTDTTGMEKVKVLKERLLKINPDLKADAHTLYYSEETRYQTEILLKETQPDFAADAIDTLSPKAGFISLCLDLRIPVISSLGAGGKTDPALIRTIPIEKTHTCRLAAALRSRLRKNGIHSGFDTVFSPEPTDRSRIIREQADGKASQVGTISYMPAAFGMHMAAYIIKKITE